MSPARATKFVQTLSQAAALTPTGCASDSTDDQSSEIGSSPEGVGPITACAMPPPVGIVIFEGGTTSYSSAS